MFSRRFILFGLVATAMLQAFGQPAEAASPGSGEGNGSSSGSNSGNGSDGNSGNGQGNNSGNNAGNGNANGNGAGGKAKGQTNGNTGVGQPSVAPTAVPAPSATIGSSVRVRHRNGFQESLNAGRYRLQDNRGRTIVDRLARPGDYARLRKLAGR